MKCKHKNTSVEELTREIHAELKRRGWTLKELAALLGVSYIYAASLSSGARKFSGLPVEKQRQLSKFLGMTLVDFYLMCGLLHQSDLSQHLID
jgi:transcriptional regulator with XRE-family HTH domain